MLPARSRSTGDSLAERQRAPSLYTTQKPCYTGTNVLTTGLVVPPHLRYVRFDLDVNGRLNQQARVERWAERIESSGLSSLALPLLEMATAFGLLGGQILLVVGPLIGGTFGETAEQASDLLSDPGLLRRLRERLTEGYGRQ